MSENKSILGAVIYTDGSAKPNPGFVGWGMHGYLYTNTPNKQKLNSSKYKITDAGYISSNKVNNKITGNIVTPIQYYDFLGSKLEIGTNNEAEMNALIYSLKHLLNENISKIQIYTDSDYLVKGIKLGIPVWKKNDWKKPNGDLLPNDSLWKTIDSLLDYCINNDITINVDWIKGHADNFGNLIADRLANIAVNYSISKIEKNDYKITDAKGYWNKELEKHPFFDHKRLYFNTDNAYNRSGQYFLAKPGNDDTIIGKKTPDAGYSLIRLKDPDPVIECIKEFQSKISDNMNNIAVMRLEKVFTDEVYNTIVEHKQYSLLCANKYNPAVNFIDDKPLTVIQNPPGLCLRAINASNILEELLESFIANKNNSSLGFDWFNVKKHDLTNIFYKTLVKNKSKKQELDSRFNVGFSNLELSVTVQYKDNPIEIKVALVLGLDLPSRNSLKRIEKLNPTITLLTWQEGSNCFRYASVVEIENAIGIWSNYYSNQIFI